MRLRTLIRVITTFFLAGQMLGFTIPQQPLSELNNDPTTKISTLQSKLASRITEHQAIMTAHFQDVSSTLANISSSLDESTLALSEFKHQLPDLEEAQMPSFLNDLFNHLKVNGGELKEDVGNGLESINQTLILMIKETGEMDLFLSHILEEMNGFEKEILDCATMNGQNNIQTFQESKSAPYVSAGSLASNNKIEEKENLESIFKYLVELDQVYPHAYAVIPSHNPANATSHARFTTVLNTTLLYGNYPCDYSCNSTAQVKFAAIPTINESVIFDWEDVSMDCTASSPGEANHALGTIAYEKGIFAIWFEHR